MDFTILYDKTHSVVSPSGKQVYSDILYIPVGKAALLSLYNMTASLDLVTDPDTGRMVLQSDDCIIVHKLSFGQTGDLARRLSCGERIDVQRELTGLLHSRRVFHEPVYQCGGAWAINPCNNYALIPVPGFYMLELFDLDQAATAYIEYALIGLEAAAVIPDDFKMGAR